MKCEYCETPAPTDETYVCSQCASKALDDPDALLIKVLQDELQRTRAELDYCVYEINLAVSRIQSISQRVKTFFNALDRGDTKPVYRNQVEVMFKTDLLPREFVIFVQRHYGKMHSGKDYSDRADRRGWGE